MNYVVFHSRNGTILCFAATEGVARNFACSSTTGCIASSDGMSRFDTESSFVAGKTLASVV